ncbi:MAG: FmdB family zinc ribbon protein [Mycobacterium sp.]
MPTYSYACTECGDRFDAVQAFSDDALTTCTKCSGRLRKLFGSVGVVFKGSGFYRTDSREAAKSASIGSSASSDKGSDKSSDKGSEKSSDKGSEKTATPSSSGEKSSGAKEKSSGSSSSAPAAAASN